VFKVGRISDSALREIAARAATLEPTYDFRGATLTSAALPGFRRDCYEIVLPDRPDAFERGAQGLRQWAAHLGAGLRVAPRDPPTLDATVAVAIVTGPLTAVAVCRIVAVVDESSRFGFAYGTLPGHPEQGEEAFLVERRDDQVLFKITALSRPAEFIARAGGPVTRRLQQATSRRYLTSLASFVDNEM